MLSFIALLSILDQAIRGYGGTLVRLLCEDSNCSGFCSVQTVEHMNFDGRCVSKEYYGEKHLCFDIGTEEKHYFYKQYASPSCLGSPLVTVSSQECYSDLGTSKSYYFECYASNKFTMDNDVKNVNFDWRVDVIVAAIIISFVFFIGILGGYLLYKQRCFVKQDL